MKNFTTRILRNPPIEFVSKIVVVQPKMVHFEEKKKHLVARM